MCVLVLVPLCVCVCVPVFRPVSVPVLVVPVQWAEKKSNQASKERREEDWVVRGKICKQESDADAAAMCDCDCGKERVHKVRV